MNYIRLYFITHLKYWWVYLISIGTLIFGYVFSMFSALFLANWGIDEVIAWVTGLIIASVIISMPMVYVNYKVAYNYISKSNKKINLFVLAACNHLVTYLVYLAVLLIILYGGK